MKNVIALLFVVCVATPALGQQSDSFATKKKSCPPVGKDKAGKALGKTTDGGLRNMAKRHLPAGNEPARLSVADFETLQERTDDITGEDATNIKTRFAPTRNKLQHLKTAHGTVSEGDLVQVTGFLTRIRPQGAESVNCAGLDGTDIHINIGAETGLTEHDGIVVEMIPQLLKPGWTATVLNRVRARGLSVLIVGGLTYDNEHLVNADAKQKKPGQPARMSLWEIHPITEFFVCESGTCDPAKHSEWMTLTTWAKKNPQ